MTLMVMHWSSKRWNWYALRPSPSPATRNCSHIEFALIHNWKLPFFAWDGHCPYKAHLFTPLSLPHTYQHHNITVHQSLARNPSVQQSSINSPHQSPRRHLQFSNSSIFLSLALYRSSMHLFVWHTLITFLNYVQIHTNPLSFLSTLK